MQNKTIDKHQRNDLILKFLVIAAVIVAVIMTFVSVKAVMDSDMSSDYSENTFYYRIENKDYASLVNMSHEYLISNSNPSGDIKKYIAVAKYYEAASLFRIYDENGDTKRASKYAKIMDEQEKEMQDMSTVIPDIKDQLGIS